MIIQEAMVWLKCELKSSELFVKIQVIVKLVKVPLGKLERGISLDYATPSFHVTFSSVLTLHIIIKMIIIIIYLCSMTISDIRTAINMGPA